MGYQNSISNAYCSVSGGSGATASKEGEVFGDSFSLPRFVDNGDGTVSDKWTGLMWQKATDPGRFYYHDARDYCTNLSLAGHEDWRMPSLQELLSIVDKTRSNPTIDPVFQAVSSYYWSCHRNNYSLRDADIVDFSDGSAALGDTILMETYVRAVRWGK